MRKPGCFILDRAIYYNNERIISLSDVKIKGKHNYENAMAAIATVKELGVESQPIIDVLKSFGGVEHRLEYVRTINQVDFYNDSKSLISHQPRWPFPPLTGQSYSLWVDWTGATALMGLRTILKG